jgi:hypothetical protein
MSIATQQQIVDSLFENATKDELQNLKEIAEEIVIDMDARLKALEVASN